MKQSFLQKRGISLIAAGGLVAVLVLAVVAYYVGKASNPSTTVAVQTATPSPSGSPSAVATGSPSPAPSNAATVKDEGVTWFASATQLDTMSLYVPPSPNPDKVTQKDVDTNIGTNYGYWKVGTYNGKDLVSFEVPQDGPGEISVGLLRIDGPGRYTIFTKETPGIDASGKVAGGMYGLAAGVSLDTKTSFVSLAEPKAITVQGVSVSRFGVWTANTDISFKVDPLTTVTKLTETPYGTLYRLSSALRGDTYKINLSTLVLRRFDGVGVQYVSDIPTIKDDAVLAATWTDGSKNKDTFRVDGGGACGSASTVAVTTVDDSALSVAGTDANGKSIYALKNGASDPLAKEVYANYKPNEEDGAPIPIAEWLAKRGLLIYKNAFGEDVILLNSSIGLAAECGKPVVYLYPQKAEQVSVKVGANITVSEPAYGDGWNVLAQPNGTLSTGGKTYDSLFWEGFGKGAYPNVTSGTVVARADVETTMRTQLRQLGLNEKESNDFMAYWLPKMPNMPYVRLTWFGTKQMDQLAPLTITPKPDSVIRIFLDFAGLQTKVTMPAQALSHIPRTGFTVIEWGGLLRP
jgi:hypothetical protein